MNKRKFRHWDNKLIFNALQKAIQIKSNIEILAINSELPVTNLPISQIDTDVLYDMVVCYEAMYDKLLEEELIINGYPKSSPTYH